MLIYKLITLLYPSGSSEYGILLPFEAIPFDAKAVDERAVNANANESKIAMNLFVNVIFCTSFYRNCPFNVIGFN